MPLPGGGAFRDAVDAVGGGGDEELAGGAYDGGGAGVGLPSRVDEEEPAADAAVGDGGVRPADAGVAVDVAAGGVRRLAAGTLRGAAVRAAPLGLFGRSAALASACLAAVQYLTACRGRMSGEDAAPQTGGGAWCSVFAEKRGGWSAVAGGAASPVNPVSPASVVTKVLRTMSPRTIRHTFWSL
ncbi:hypothetical protein GCM10020001_082810 [Nonomuraea salmonea]